MHGMIIGDTIPNLEVETTRGKIKIHDYVGSGYVILFSHLGDFTLVCTIELGVMAMYAPDFEKCGVKLLGLSYYDVDTHKKLTKDIEAYASDGCKVHYPIVEDPKRELIKKLNMVGPEERDDQG